MVFEERMSKTKKHIIVAILGCILVLPSLLYFVANGYWWLFGEQNYDSDKMGASLFVGILGLAVWFVLHTIVEENK